MDLSERQQKTIAAALTILAALVIVSACLGLFWLLASFVRYFSHVFLPLAVAGISALTFQPYYDWLHVRQKFPMPLAVATLFLSMLLPIGVIVGYFSMVVVIPEVVDLIETLPNWWKELLVTLERLGPEIRTFLEKHPMGQKILPAMRGQGPMLTAGLEYLATTSMVAGTNVAGWTGVMLSWAIAPVYFVFFLTMRRANVSKLEDYLPFLKEKTRKDVVFLAREFVNIIVAFFRGQIVIAFLQGIMLAIGFNIVGLRYGFVLGFLLGFLNVIPYLGSMLGLAITLPLAYLQSAGGLPTLAGVIVVLGLVQLVEGYVLTPKIMGDRTGLHPMAIIVAVFFWGAAMGGILGMILAIPLTAFLVVFWRLAKEKYISELV